MKKRCVNCFQEYEDTYYVCPFCGYAEGDGAKELFYLQPGTKLADRYIIGRGIGHGGFGITYLAWDTKLEIAVAVKEYYPCGIVNRVPGTTDVILFAGSRKKQFSFGFSRFLEEAKNMAQFSSHKNIDNVFEYFEANHTAYIVMEYLDGVPLDRYLTEHGGKLTPEETVRFVLMICNALKEIHKKGIIHRDIAPDNIMVQPDGNLKLFDFGAARFSLNEDRQMTVIVKPGFAPPEQYNKINRQGPWTDIYALGAMMYMMLTGVKPDESTNRIVEDTVKPPRELNADIPEYLSNAVMKAIAMNPVLRFQNISDMEKALLQQKKVYSPETDKKRRMRRRLIAISGSAAAVCVLAVVFGSRFWKQYVPPATLEVWYQQSGVGTLDVAKQEAMEKMAEQFQEFYPQVKVKLTAVSQEEYAEKWDAAVKDGKTPDLFESTGMTAEQLSDCADIGKKLDETILTDCWFSEDAAADPKQVALGFQIPVLYLNTSLTDAALSEDDLAVQKITGQEITLTVTGKTPVTVSAADGQMRQRDAAVLETLFPEAKFTETAGASDFLGRDADCYFADSGDYLAVITSLPGQTAAIPMAETVFPDDMTPCDSDFQWSASSSGKAAVKLLEYMLSEEGQEILMVQNQSSVMPLNQAALEHYCSVYQEIFESIPEKAADGKLEWMQEKDGNA